MGLIHKGKTNKWGGYMADMSNEEVKTAWQGEGTSIFDPVLCELCYRWFNVPGGKVLDPFAGGSVRGIVSAFCGMPYTGIELRPEQVEANIEQLGIIDTGLPLPEWICGDSANMQNLLGAGFSADFVFSCPPYGSLEVYSDLPGDISAMDGEGFADAYKKIIASAVGLLKKDRFAVFVVGNYRDKKGFMCDLVGETVRAFEVAGARFYNEMILINPSGSLPIRVGKQFNGGRKIGKTHQNVLVFYKGDPKKIKENYPEIDFSQITDNSDLTAI